MLAFSSIPRTVAQRQRTGFFPVSMVVLPLHFHALHLVVLSSRAPPPAYHQQQNLTSEATNNRFPHLNDDAASDVSCSPHVYTRNSSAVWPLAFPMSSAMPRPTSSAP